MVHALGCLLTGADSIPVKGRNVMILSENISNYSIYFHSRVLWLPESWPAERVLSIFLTKLWSPSSILMASEG